MSCSQGYISVSKMSNFDWEKCSSPINAKITFQTIIFEGVLSQIRQRLVKKAYLNT